MSLDAALRAWANCWLNGSQFHADTVGAMRQGPWFAPPHWFQRLFDRFFGVKPGRDAPKLDRLLWFRGYYLRPLPAIVVVWALLLALHVSWALLAVIWVPWLLGFALLNAEIRHERRPPPGVSRK